MPASSVKVVGFAKILFELGKERERQPTFEGHVGQVPGEDVPVDVLHGRAHALVAGSAPVDEEVVQRVGDGVNRVPDEVDELVLLVAALGVDPQGRRLVRACGRDRRCLGILEILH